MEQNLDENHQSRELPGESIKRPAFEKMLLPEYHRNGIEKCLVLFPTCPVNFINLPGFNRPFLPVKMGDCLHKAPFENLQERVKTTSKDQVIQAKRKTFSFP